MCSPADEHADVEDEPCQHWATGRLGAFEAGMQRLREVDGIYGSAKSVDSQLQARRRKYKTLEYVDGKGRWEGERWLPSQDKCSHNRPSDAQVPDRGSAR